MAAIEVGKALIPRTRHMDLVKYLFVAPEIDVFLLSDPDSLGTEYRTMREIIYPHHPEGDTPEHRMMYAFKTALGMASGDPEVPGDWISPFQDTQTALEVTGEMEAQEFGWAWLARFEKLLGMDFGSIIAAKRADFPPPPQIR